MDIRRNLWTRIAARSISTISGSDSCLILTFSIGTILSLTRKIVNIAGNVVIGGNPAHVLSSIEDYYDKNKKYNMNTKGMNPSQKKAVLMAADERCFISK